MERWADPHAKSALNRTPCQQCERSDDKPLTVRRAARLIALELFARMRTGQSAQWWLYVRRIIKKPKFLITYNRHRSCANCKNSERRQRALAFYHRHAHDSPFLLHWSASLRCFGWSNFWAIRDHVWYWWNLTLLLSVVLNVNPTNDQGTDARALA